MIQNTMKYEPSAIDDYESGITAQSLVDVVEGLVQKYFGLEEAKRIVEAELNAALVWNNPILRGEIEEFIFSYLITGLRGTKPKYDLAETDNKSPKLKAFKEFLEEIQRLGLAQESDTSSLTELNRRADRFFIEVKGINQLDCDYTVKQIAFDGLGNIYSPYHGRIQLANFTAK